MPVIIHEPDFPRLPPEELAAWAKIPTTIIVDDTDGAAFVDPDIRALPQGVSFAGQALTIEAPSADISGVQHALPLGWPGAVMVIAADGRFSRMRKLSGLEGVSSAPPMDVAWGRVARAPSDGHGIGGVFIAGGNLIVLLPREDSWQLGYVFPKGDFANLKSRGIEAFSE